MAPSLLGTSHLTEDGQVKDQAGDIWDSRSAWDGLKITKGDRTLAFIEQCTVWGFEKGRDDELCASYAPYISGVTSVDTFELENRVK